MWSHCLLASVVSDEKSVNILTGSLAWAESLFLQEFFCLSTFKLLSAWVWISLHLFCMEFIELLRCVGYVSLDLGVGVLPLFLLLFFLAFCLSSPSGTLHVCQCTLVSPISLRLCLFIFIPVLFSSLNHLYWPIIKSADSLQDNLWLNPSDEFFISVILFNLRISIWFF